MKTINVSFDDEVFEELQKLKGVKSWRTFIILGAKEWKKAE